MFLKDGFILVYISLQKLIIHAKKTPQSYILIWVAWEGLMKIMERV